MRKLNKIAPCFFVLLSACYFTSCGDLKGASQPLSYAPATAASLWIPPACLAHRSEDIDDIEDYKLEKSSLSLGEVIDLALHNSPQTKKSWNMAKAAAANYGRSLKDYFITSNLTSDYNNYQEAYFTELNTTNSVTNINNANINPDAGQSNTFHGLKYGAQLNLSYTILDFGQTRATSKAALAALHEADFSHNQEIQKVMNKVMNDLYHYLAQKARVVAAEENVKNATVSLDSVTEKFQFGVANVSDTIQATTKLLEEKLTLVNEQKSLTYAYTNLLTSMGYPANSYLTFENFPEKLELFDLVDLSSLIKIASCSRPELLAAESSMRMYEEKLSLARAQKYPVVTASFDVGRENANLGIGSYFDYMLSINLNFPLFQGFFLENGIKKAQADLETSKARLKQIQLQLVQEITNVFHDVSYAKEAYLYAKEYLKSAELDFKVNLEEYKAGTSTIVDLINAQTSIANARAKFIETQKNWYSSLANLSYSTGLITSDPTAETKLQVKSSPCAEIETRNVGESF